MVDWKKSSGENRRRLQLNGFMLLDDAVTDENRYEWNC
jgi:hypothetical protein